MAALTLYQTSSLNKTLITDREPPRTIDRLTCLKGEEVSYQIVCKMGYNRDVKTLAKLTVESPLGEYITVREIGNVPSELPAYIEREDAYDDDYITTSPGLFPDPLFDITDNTVELIPNFYRALWVTVKTNCNMEAGEYPVKITLQNAEKEIYASVQMSLKVINAVLPSQKLIVTQWFHADCLASYYHVDALSERHWEIIEEFIKTAADNGINMLLTPIFTPPLDTEIGRERPTVQLMDVDFDGEKYSFDFSRLKTWIGICKKHGIQYLEMAHLFTQWGAKCTPKIVVRENGHTITKFGWHVSADSEEYAMFLKQFLPALTAFLEEEGVAQNTYFHVSDEPYEPDKESYRRARNMVKPLLKEYKVIDAFSDYALYTEGLSDNPVVALHKIKPFLENQVKPLWVYYCCTQCAHVSNRFFAMPSARNRIIGLQMYKFDIEGFLQWGYNFYYSQLSRGLINPFVTTDARNAFPSGDPFSVYPSDEGRAIESIRLKVFKEALQDIQALQLLEEYIPKEEIIHMMEQDAGCVLEFDCYPKEAEFVLNFREKVNRMIEKAVENQASTDMYTSTISM